MYQIYDLKLYFIVENFKCFLRTFGAQFWVLGVKSKNFSEIWQFCQIHLKKKKKITGNLFIKASH